MTARWAPLLLALAWASPALAWPVDWIHDVEPGKEKFVKLPRVDWFELEDPKVASVEWMADANELILTGLKPGRTVLLLGADGKVAAWRIRVGGKPVLDDKLWLSTQKACPDFTATPLEPIKLTVTVKDEKCRLALLSFFQTDAFEARVVEVAFDGAALQAQLKSVQEGLDAVSGGALKGRYAGAGLILTGKTSAAAWRKGLWEVLRRAVGRFALDDRTEHDAPP